MNYEINEVKEKPDGWPANAIECQLENIQEYIDKFKRNPDYKNKEVLVSLISDYDLNQRSTIGLCRTTEYEVAIINSLFVEAYLMQLNALKIYLYELVGYKTRTQKMLSYMFESEEKLEIDEFDGLFLQLKLYYLAYQKFTVKKNKSLAEQLIEIIEYYVKLFENEELDSTFMSEITRAYISMLNDISYFRCARRTKIWTFNHKEIGMLYKLVAKLIKINGDIPVKRPLKGVLMTSISNYVLKSRNNYNEDYICKYISLDVAKKSIDNHQIWMSPIDKLNDPREQKVIPEIFENINVKTFPWAKNIDFTPTRKYYVSSFCKSLNDADMIKDYGECIYGYKDDRMAEILSPIMYYKNDKGRTPKFSHVLSFDVIYDKEEAKKELEFLCSIIDYFDMSEENKKDFLEEILQYWILSVKDSKWSHERERRYVLFMYDDYKYIDVDLNDSRFFKLKSSLFIEPDFILGSNPIKQYIRNMVDNKRNAISMKPYLFCIECLNRDFDIVVENKKCNKCPICGSTNIFIEDPNKPREEN